jgi:hypothetical protein
MLFLANLGAFGYLAWKSNRLAAAPVVPATMLSQPEAVLSGPSCWLQAFESKAGPRHIDPALAPLKDKLTAAPFGAWTNFRAGDGALNRIELADDTEVAVGTFLEQGDGTDLEFSARKGGVLLMQARLHVSYGIPAIVAGLGKGTTHVWIDCHSDPS